MKRVIALLISCTLLFSSCNFSEKQDEKIGNGNQDDTQIQNRIVAAWIYYNEIKELVDSSLSQEEFMIKTDSLVEKLSEYSVNTIILHIRAFDDAFYNSQLFPVSKYCSNEEGKLKFDVLECFLTICHSRNIKLWGWINPYRINKEDDISVIKEGYFQFDALHSQNEQILIHSENGIYYNPADSNVKKHIVDGIREVLENYDIDGIHFDDYFYPRTDSTFDSSYYEEYEANGGMLSISDFRRENVNSLIYSVYELTKKYNKVFSVSPASDINKNYNSYYADVKLWAVSDSYVDYIIPQIYFGFENSFQPFAETLRKWVELTGDSKNLLVGLALYKSGITENYVKTGIDEWKSRDVVSREIDYICKSYENIGFVYYSSSYLYAPEDEGICEENENIKKVLRVYFPSSVT